MQSIALVLTTNNKETKHHIHQKHVRQTEKPALSKRTNKLSPSLVRLLRPPARRQSGSYFYNPTACTNLTRTPATTACMSLHRTIHNYNNNIIIQKFITHTQSSIKHESEAQYSTEQFWSSSILSCRQSSLLRCWLSDGRRKWCIKHKTRQPALIFPTS